MFQPVRTNFQSCCIIGQCCNKGGTVELMRYLPLSTVVAVKRINLDNYDTNGFAEELELLQTELCVSRQLSHPNVLYYHLAFVSGTELLMVSPLMAFGSCQDLIQNHFVGGLPELAIALILRDVLLGLEYIHKKGFIHRAIRASHILVSSSGRACLSGLRYSYNIVRDGRRVNTVHSFPNSTQKNLNWLSPEVLEQNLKGYNESSDIYSIGITLCELANGVEPFSGMPTTLMLMEKVRGSVPQLLDISTVSFFKEYGFSPQPCGLLCEDEVTEEEEDEIRVSVEHIGYGDTVASARYEQRRAMLERTLSEAFHDLTQLCLLREPSARPTAAQLLQHQFFKQCRRASQHLPDLLRPVLPLTDNRTASYGDPELLFVSESLSDLEIAPLKWNF
ncbi:STE20-related kinase adapter protein alpha isoform X1 [Schistocerca gregaria]|uniref:STE20-related kinase adapter protein alpha isoform X1 n=1 Tax=Schistocerca gregaria TaxID=7010 RepID=UPI00211E7854|nr:STE20-related kinase adapter protein alpha isoform X1 [Schistocerca gregaria]XP_049835524.1 STE20-related kinase adapter protein alpha isoform X1 [Schistocerca gregaria]